MVALGRPREVEDLGWTQGFVYVLGKALGNLDMCYHHGHDQILATIDAPRFLTCQSLRKESQGSEVGWKESLTP